MADLFEEIQSELISIKADALAWAYHRDGTLASEPSILASMGLLSAKHQDVTAQLRRVGQWLSGLQRPDGSVCVSESVTFAGWPTPLAVLLWSNLGGFEAESRQAVSWLLERKGRAADSALDGGLLGHDPSIVGWPWIQNTHSWVEPTAMAIMALSRVGLSGHPRVQEGLGMILNRTLPNGGWNYGNVSVFGNTLRPRPATTGIAILSLLAGGIDPRHESIKKAAEFLRSEIPRTKSPQSLCWGGLALRSCGKAKDASRVQWRSAFQNAKSRSDSAIQLAYLLMSLGSESLAVLGVPDRTK